MRLKIVSLVLLLLASLFANALTWDEPWQDRVIKEAGYFVYAKVISTDEKKVSIEIIQTLAGPALSGKLDITTFYLLNICSSSGGEGPEFHLRGVDSCYFFIKKINDTFCIATPTSGFAPVREGKVMATYRHSYHQCFVSREVYEKTMTAIFNHYHGLPFETDFIKEHIKKYLSLKPAGFEKNELDNFFNQHVALETIYHLRLTGYYDRILPFLNDKNNFHNQVSAARALGAYNTPECKNVLLLAMNDKDRRGFVKVMCIQSLSEFKPVDFRDKLADLQKTASDESDDFGGNIMDPRVCTHVPTVKQALEDLMEELKK